MAAGPDRLTRRRWRTGLTLALGVLVVAIIVMRWGAIERITAPPAEVLTHGVLRVGIDPSYPPFAAAGDDGFHGLEIDLARALGQELGVPVQFVALGYDGLYDALRVDSVDILISALLIDPARRNDARYTRPYFDAGLVLVSAAGTPFGDMAVMSGHALAYEFGSAADAEARRWLRRVQPFERRPYESARYALDAVRLGEADAALVDKVTARLYLREHRDWAAQSFRVTSHSYAIAVRADRGAVWALVNDALEALAASDQLDAIVNRWL